MVLYHTARHYLRNSLTSREKKKSTRSQTSISWSRDKQRFERWRSGAPFTNGIGHRHSLVAPTFLREPSRSSNEWMHGMLHQVVALALYELAFCTEIFTQTGSRKGIKESTLSTISLLVPHPQTPSFLSYPQSPHPRPPPFFFCADDCSRHASCCLLRGLCHLFWRRRFRLQDSCQVSQRRRSLCLQRPQSCRSFCLQRRKSG